MCVDKRDKMQTGKILRDGGSIIIHKVKIININCSIGPIQVFGRHVHKPFTRFTLEFRVRIFAGT